MRPELLLVQLKLLLKCGKLVYHMLLIISKLLDDLGTLVFLLLHRELEILSL
jgi:hypothetical protein